MKKLILLFLVSILFHTSRSQNIAAAEYFIDIDPGPGNGTAITPITPGDVVNFSTTISTGALPTGFHFLAIRVKDVNGVWSLFEHRGFYISGAVSETDNITAAEYFFDNDPGPGNGTALSVGTPGAVVNFTPVIPQSLSTGFHYLAIRTKDAAGNWSLFERRNFYVSGTVPASPIITAAEYFLDTDPGRGNGTALTITTPGDIVTQTFNISLSRTISLGQHFLGIYVRDQDNNWSQFAYDTLNVKIKAPATDVTVNVAPGQCSQVVNNIDAQLLNGGDPFTYTLTGATTGTGNGNASGLSFNTGITTVTYTLTNEPTAFSSFTVTVVDNENPTISCPSNITVTASGPGGTVVNYSNPSIGDNCAGAILSQTAGLPSGSTFPIGITTNTFLVTDASGNTNTCSFTVTVSPALPVHLISFTAVKQGAKSLLQWVTENEINNSHFEVQRSADGIMYTVIGRVDASLSPVDPKHYSFTDLQPHKGNNYYRLRQVDIDNRFVYTPVRKLRFDDKLNLLTVYPNPVNDELLVDFSTKEKSIELRLFDATGKLLLTRRMNNELLIRLPVRELAAGIYYLHVSDGEVTAQAAFVKQ